MAALRRVIKLSIGKADLAELESIARSRTEPACRVEGARVLLLALPAWDQQEETEQSDSRTDRGRAIDTKVQSELVSPIVPRGTS
jgi:hypothetical protein